MILNATITMNWRLPSLNAVILFVCLTVIAWAVTKVALIIIRIIIVIRQVILGRVVSKSSLIARHVSFLVWYLSLTVLYLFAAAIMVQLDATRR